MVFSFSDERRFVVRDDIPSLSRGGLGWGWGNSGVGIGRTEVETHPHPSLPLEREGVLGGAMLA